MPTPPKAVQKVVRRIAGEETAMQFHGFTDHLLQPGNEDLICWLFRNQVPFEYTGEELIIWDKHMSPGDWVILDSNGALTTCTAAEFEAKYQEVP